jgi:phosphoglycolate phosphatase
MTVPHGELIIFDLDGTLVDSVQQIISSANSVRVDYGVGARNSKEIFDLVGLPPALFFSDLNIDESEIEVLVRNFRSTLEQTQFTSLDIYPYARDLILFLKEKDYFLGIATNKPTQNAKNLLEKVGLLEFFTYVQGSDHLSPKPSPQIIDRVLASIPSTFAVMVGDRIEDIEAARSAGIPSIGVSQTAHNQADLARAGAGLTFSSIKDLFKSISETGILDTLRP